MKPCDGKIIIHSVPANRTKFYDSHTVSLLANLSRLSWDKKEKLADDPTAASAKPILEELSRLVHEENAAFRNEIKIESLFERLYVTSKQANKRIMAQAGAFIIVGLRDGDKRAPSNLRISHFTIPKRAKAKVLKQLDELGINGRTMFPELDKAAKY